MYLIAALVTTLAFVAPHLDASPVQRLANGFRLAVCERRVSSLVAIDLWIRAGSRWELPGEEGSAHFLEHTLFKGTDSRRAGQIDLDMERLGGSLDAATGPDCVHFLTSVPRAHLSKALAILADVIRNPTLPVLEIERERGVILDEISRRAGRDAGHVSEALYAAAFAGHPYGHSAGGERDDIRRLNRRTILGFYRRNYAPDRSVLALAGDISPYEAMLAADASFGSWHNDNEAEAVLQAPPQWPSGLRSDVVGRKPGVVEIGLAFPATAASDHAGCAAARLIAAVLGSADTAGRLHVQELAGTLASAHFSAREAASMLYITATADLATARNVELAVRRAVLSLTHNPPSEMETAAATAAISEGLPFRIETDAEIAEATGAAISIGGDTPLGESQSVRALSRPVWLRFIQNNMDLARAVTVIVSPPGRSDVTR